MPNNIKSLLERPFSKKGIEGILEHATIFIGNPHLLDEFILSCCFLNQEKNNICLNVCIYSYKHVCTYRERLKYLKKMGKRERRELRREDEGETRTQLVVVSAIISSLLLSSSTCYFILNGHPFSFPLRSGFSRCNKLFL